MGSRAQQLIPRGPHRQPEQGRWRKDLVRSCQSLIGGIMAAKLEPLDVRLELDQRRADALLDAQASLRLRVALNSASRRRRQTRPGPR